MSMWLSEFGGVDNLVFYIFCGVAGLILILSLINLILGCALGKNRSVSSSVDFHICLGTLLLSFNVLVQGLDQAWDSVDAFEVICQIYHVVLLIGLTQFIGGLFVKGWTLFLFYKYNQEKKPLSEEWIPNLLIWILLLIIAGVSLAWVFLYTPSYDSTTMTCTSKHEFEWKIATSAWHGLLLVLALIAVPANCAVTRGTPGSAEASILSVVTVNTLLCVVAGVCIYFLYFPMEQVEKTIEYAIMGGLMLWMCLFADIMFLISKVCGYRNSAGNTDYGDNYDTIESNRNSMTQANPSYDGDLANGKVGENDTFQY